eukprot:gene6767-7565_t
MSFWDKCFLWFANGAASSSPSCDAIANRTTTQQEQSQQPSFLESLSLFGGKEVISLPDRRLRIDGVLAQGGFSTVLEATDADDSRKKYALKKMIAHDAETLANIREEINIMKKLWYEQTPEHIIRFETAVANDLQNMSMKSPTEVLVLLELCQGSVANLLLADEALQVQVVKSIFTQAALAISFLHNQSPPIIHRDVKAENFLLTSDNIVKLCDFGSCTTETIDPSQLDYRGKMLTAERLESVTTPQNRSPEMLDLFSEQPINAKLDVWMEPSSPLSMLNINFLKTLLERLLVKDVAQRASADEQRVNSAVDQTMALVE